MATSYDDLISETPLWAYAQNRDLVAEMPSIVAKAESQIFEMIDHDLFQDIITTKTLTKGNPMLDLTSDDIREVRAIRLKYRTEDHQYTPLERRNLETMTMLYNQNRLDRPRFYAEHGGFSTFQVFPTPREDYDLSITVNRFPESLGPSVQTNILSDMFPRVYEQGCLLQAAIFMKNPTDAATYKQEMIGAITEANATIARRRRDETGTRAVETANQSGV